MPRLLSVSDPLFALRGADSRWLLDSVEVQQRILRQVRGVLQRVLWHIERAADSEVSVVLGRRWSALRVLQEDEGTERCKVSASLSRLFRCAFLRRLPRCAAGVAGDSEVRDVRQPGSAVP